MKSHKPIPRIPPNKEIKERIVLTDSMIFCSENMWNQWMPAYCPKCKKGKNCPDLKELAEEKGEEIFEELFGKC